MSDKNVTLGLIQLHCSSDKEANIAKTFKKIKDAAHKGAQIVVLQELFSTRYFCQSVDESNFELAESMHGLLENKLSGLAEELNIVLITPFFEKRAPGIYHNSLMVVDADGTVLGTYRKKHIPDDPCFHEKYYFTPGDEEYKVFDTKYAKIGTLICWDQWFPEAARITALKGAELLVFPSAIGTLSDENEAEKKKFIEAWKTMQCSHAIANGCFVASVNRTGQEEAIDFWGRSFISDPFGEIIAQAGEAEEVLVSQIKLSTIEKQRQQWPFLRDRRTDTYPPILKRFIDDI